jgi:hypothetical protein
MNGIITGVQMNDALSAIMSGFELVLLSMIIGAIFYALIKDSLPRNRPNDK